MMSFPRQNVLAGAEEGVERLFGLSHKTENGSCKTAVDEPLGLAQGGSWSAALHCF